jgi:hypothetical protein
MNVAFATASPFNPRGAGGMTPLALRTPREARIRRVFEGVVASYIHDISVRTARANGGSPDQRTRALARSTRSGVTSPTPVTTSAASASACCSGG